jgi:predicted RNA-binding protein YlxR (DUF448 family)
MDTPSINPGEKNDPSVEIGKGGSAVVTPQFREAMELLGFQESEGSFVFNSGGRAIWVNPSSPSLTADVTKQIVAHAEQIGARTKINEIRKALDLPFGVVDVLKPAHEH